MQGVYQRDPAARLRRFLIIRVSTCLVLAVLALGFAAPQTADASVSEPGVVRGYVYSFEQPIAPLEGISVRAYRWNGSSLDIANPVTTTTAADGSYALTGLIGTDPYVFAFAETTGARRDLTYFRRGLQIGDSNLWIPDLIDSYVNEFLRTKTDQAAFRGYRVAGAGVSGRYGTAIEISRNNFYAAETVVLASGAGFADALAAAPLAGLYDAPLLLTPTNELPPGLTGELDRLATNAGVAAVKVIIVGGTNSVSNAVRNQVIASGIPAGNVTRIAGADRYDTASLIAKRVQAASPNKEPYVCRGDVFADALAVSPFAYRDARPILLTPTTGPNTVVRNAWSSMHTAAGDYVIFIGGPNSITESVYYGFRDVSYPDDMNKVLANAWVYGSDRYLTAAEVVTFHKDVAYDMVGGFDFIGVASGANYPDALAGGVATGYNGGALVLTPPTSLSTAARGTLQRSGLYVVDMQVFGGTSAVSGSTLSAAKSAIGSAMYDIDGGTAP